LTAEQKERAWYQLPFSRAVDDRGRVKPEWRRMFIQLALDDDSPWEDEPQPARQPAQQSALLPVRRTAFGLLWTKARFEL